MTPLETLVIGLWVSLFVLCIGIIINNWRHTQPQEKQPEKTQPDKTKPEALLKQNPILIEVKFNEGILNRGYHTNKWGHRIYLHRLFRDAFDNAKATEKFNSFSAQIQKAVSLYYGGIDRWNKLVNKSESEQRALTLQGIFNEQNALETTLRKATNDLKELLKSEDSNDTSLTT